MTVRRALGTGCEAPARGVRAAQADLLGPLPGVRLPDLDELRARGVLGVRPTASRSPGRILWVSGGADDNPRPAPDAVSTAAEAAADRPRLPRRSGAPGSRLEDVTSSAPIVVHAPTSTGGRRVTFESGGCEKTLGTAHSDHDLAVFLQAAGIDDPEALLDDPRWVEWRGGLAHDWSAP